MGNEKKIIEIDKMLLLYLLLVEMYFKELF